MQIKSGAAVLCDMSVQCIASHWKMARQKANVPPPVAAQNRKPKVATHFGAISLDTLQILSHPSHPNFLDPPKDHVRAKKQ